MIVKQCFKLNVLITISAAVSRLVFLNQMARQNGKQLNVCNVTPLDLKELESLIKERLSQRTFTNDQKSKN